LNSAGIGQYLVICDFLAFQYPTQNERHIAQALVAMLCVILSERNVSSTEPKYCGGNLIQFQNFYYLHDFSGLKKLD
jgi:hypothetical protein